MEELKSSQPNRARKAKLLIQRIFDRFSDVRWRDEETGFVMPEPTYNAGVFVEPIVFNDPPAGPSQSEIKNRALIDEALAIKDPWAGEPPEINPSWISGR